MMKQIGLFFFTALAITGYCQKKPNVIIIYTDQHNANTLGFMGHPDVITPNFDKLALSGTAFKRAYCPDAICAPSRNALMSGLYPRTLGCLNNAEKSFVMDEAVSMSTAFKANGYNTYTYGKRHTLQSIDKGWDVKKSHIYLESPDENYVSWVGKEGYGHAFALDWAAEFGQGAKGSEEEGTSFPKADMGTRLSALPENKTMEAYTAMETIKMIKEQAKTGNAFFLLGYLLSPASALQSATAIFKNV